MMTRMEFLRSVAGLGVGAIGVAALAGCGGDDDPKTIDAPVSPPVDAPSADAPVDAPDTQRCTATTNVVISSNHMHALVVPVSDITAGATKTYDIQGTSQHGHTVEITSAMFAMLATGASITATSSNDGGHTHNVTVRCA